MSRVQSTSSRARPSARRIMRAKVFGVLAPYTLFVTLLLVAAASSLT
ncbi:MAG: hypothetical protein R2851_05485 [Caldilineaceae bacterium]